MTILIKRGITDMKKTKAVILISLIVLFSGICVYSGFVIHWFNNAELQMHDKTHVKLSVSEEDIIDCNAFFQPEKDKTAVLEQIDEFNRIQIAEYMKKNNFKLKKGDYYFPKPSIIDGKEVIISFDEYAACFEFEKIK